MWHMLVQTRKTELLEKHKEVIRQTGYSQTNSLGSVMGPVKQVSGLEGSHCMG